MVNLQERLKKVKAMVERGDYFTVNRARQYGKTTLLKALGRCLQTDYVVVSLDFQKLSHSDFETESLFVQALAGEILNKPSLQREMPAGIQGELQTFAYGKGHSARLANLFRCFSRWCEKSQKPVVLLIDEVDSAADNQVFLDFLAQMRACYIDRDETAAFQSVILAGVYDIKNLKRKFPQNGEYKLNSPWNVAADFLVDMSFSAEDIAGMLMEYEADHRTGMDIGQISALIYDYTAGYPFLASRICKLLDERIPGNSQYEEKKSAWTKAGVLEALRILLTEPNTLFESLINKLENYPELKEMLWDLLFRGKEIVYVIGVRSIEIALMFGFVKKENNTILVANRIFEILLYNYFLASPDMRQSEMYDAALKDKSRFVEDGHLNMGLVLQKFVVHFNDIFGGRQQSFLEEDGRRYFLLYLRPIINGVGNYYIEAQTRNRERTDVIVDYRGEQFIIELKVWRGNAYNERGEDQLLDYLAHYHLKKGYMISFSFNKKKQPGVRENLRLHAATDNLQGSIIMESKPKRIEFRFGKAGKLAPLLVAAAMIGWAASGQSNVNGYVLAFFAALVTGVIFAKDEKAYGEALVYGIGKPMFAVIVLAVILAAVSGKLISASGAVQTIAAYVVAAGFTGKLFVAAAFLITCLLAFATGTSVGTYFVVIPILFPVGVMAGAAPEFMIGAIVSGAAFGDNLGPISDTTIASSATQHADLGAVVKTRMRYSLPAAAGALVLFLLFSKTTDGNGAVTSSGGEANPASLAMLVVPAAIIVLCMMRKHLITALSFGILAGVAAGLVFGVYGMEELISFPGGFSVSGVIIEAITGTAGTIAMLVAVFALLGVLECGGLFEDVRGFLERFAKKERSTEAAIILSVGILSMVTGVISVAIVALGDLVNEIGEKAGVDRYRRANLMDCTGCVFCFLAPWTVHCVIPAQQTVQFGEGFAVAPASVPFVNYYSLCMLAVLLAAVIGGYGRKNAPMD